MVPKPRFVLPLLCLTDPLALRTVAGGTVLNEFCPLDLSHDSEAKLVRAHHGGILFPIYSLVPACGSHHNGAA
jgi:hypothetical protein